MLSNAGSTVDAMWLSAGERAAKVMNEREVAQYPHFLRWSAIPNAFLLRVPPWVPSFPIKKTKTGAQGKKEK